MKFDPSKETIEELYSEPKSFQYLIPKYQRPYSWRKENIDEFWNTILTNESTFVGTVIFNVFEYDKNRIKEIIDGQQRYLTIAIFASALRNFLMELSKNSLDEKIRRKAREKALDIHEMYIGKKNKRNDNYEYYLIPGDTTKEYFQKNIQFMDELFFDDNDSNEVKISKPNPIKAEEILIKSAYDTFKIKINDYFTIGNRTIEEVFELIYNLEKLFVIRIEIDDYSLAFEIFESVNDQGVNLSVSDLVKNQIFRGINDVGNKIEEAEEKWNEMITNIEGKPIGFSPQEFLRYYWSSKYGYVSDKNLYKAIKNEVNNENWNLFLNDLLSNSEIVRNIIDFNKSDWQNYSNFKDGSKLFKSINNLKDIKAKTWVVLILTIFRKSDDFEKLGFKKEFIVKKIENIQSFTFFYFSIMGMPGNWYFSTIWNAAKDIQNATSKEKVIDVFSKLFLKFTEKTKVKIDDFATEFKKIQYSNNSRSIIRYVLSEIELELRGKGSEGWNEDLISIEHFVPQDPKNWSIIKNDVKGHINLLGNLVLIPADLNGMLGNKSCSEKIEKIKNVHCNMLQLNQLVENIENETWEFNKINKNNLAAIEERQKFLTEIGYKIWVTDLNRKLM
jgi:uncharacterized protein with ParB-like and HNH nuclease domain